MTEELVTVETAKLAKRKGFDIACRNGWEWYEWEGRAVVHELDPPEIREGTFYPPEEKHHPANANLMKTLHTRKMKAPFFQNSHLPPYLYARPSQDLLERWLREVHRIHVVLDTLFSEAAPIPKFVAVVFNMKLTHVHRGETETTHELAREAALQHALNLLP